LPQTTPSIFSLHETAKLVSNLPCDLLVLPKSVAAGKQEACRRKQEEGIVNFLLIPVS
jgi:hypothetical protein